MMNLKSFLCMASLSALCAAPIAARADTTYQVNGLFDGPSGPALSGSYTITDAGVVTSADLMVNGISFTTVYESTAPSGFQNYDDSFFHDGTANDYINLDIYNLATVCTTGNEPCIVNLGGGLTFPAFSDAFVSGYQYNLYSATATAVPSATPEPSGLLLLGTGVLGVAGAVRRRFLKA